MSGNGKTALTEPMYYILMAFLQEERCGTEVVEYVERRTRGRVQLGPGTLYTIMARFLEDDWIEETAVDGRRRTYRLTDAGRAAFDAELARLRECAADGKEALS